MTSKEKAAKELTNYYPFRYYEIMYLLDYIVVSGKPISTVINSIQL